MEQRERGEGADGDGRPDVSLTLACKKTFSLNPKKTGRPDMPKVPQKRPLELRVHPEGDHLPLPPFGDGQARSEEGGGSTGHGADRNGEGARQDCKKELAGEEDEIVALLALLALPRMKEKKLRNALVAKTGGGSPGSSLLCLLIAT